MFDFFLLLMHEINMTTTNLIYFVMGLLVYHLIMSLVDHDDIIKQFHMKATELYEYFRSLEEYDSVSFRNLYNKVIIRSISILALNGSLKFKSLDFIDREISLITELSNRNEARTIADSCKTFIEDIHKLSSDSKRKIGLAKVLSVFRGRKK